MATNIQRAAEAARKLLDAMDADDVREAMWLGKEARRDLRRLAKEETAILRIRVEKIGWDAWLCCTGNGEILTAHNLRVDAMADAADRAATYDGPIIIDADATNKT